MEVLSFTIWAGGALRDMEVVAAAGAIPVTRVSDVVKWGRLYLIL